MSRQTPFQKCILSSNDSGTNKSKFNGFSSQVIGQQSQAMPTGFGAAQACVCDFHLLISPNQNLALRLKLGIANELPKRRTCDLLTTEAIHCETIAKLC